MSEEEEEETAAAGGKVKCFALPFASSNNLLYLTARNNRPSSSSLSCVANLPECFYTRLLTAEDDRYQFSLKVCRRRTWKWSTNLAEFL